MGKHNGNWQPNPHCEVAGCCMAAWQHLGITMQCTHSKFQMWMCGEVFWLIHVQFKSVNPLVSQLTWQVFQYSMKFHVSCWMNVRAVSPKFLKSNVKKRCGLASECEWTAAEQITAHSWVWYTCEHVCNWSENVKHYVSSKGPLKRGTTTSLQPKRNFTLISVNTAHYPMLFLPSLSYCKKHLEEASPNTLYFSCWSIEQKKHLEIFPQMINCQSTNVICNGVSHIIIACKWTYAYSYVKRKHPKPIQTWEYS